MTDTITRLWPLDALRLAVENYEIDRMNEDELDAEVERVANVGLAAYASMLEALRLALDVDTEGGPLNADDRAFIEAAIAQATGETVNA